MILTVWSKGDSVKGGGEMSQVKVVKRLRAMNDVGDKDADWVAECVEKLREVVLPEAFFRIDDQLKSKTIGMPSSIYRHVGGHACILPVTYLCVWRELVLPLMVTSFNTMDNIC